MKNILQYSQSSIGKKQIVASTGLVLILFVIGHLAGNLLIFLGDEVFNNYAKKMAGLRPGLYLIEAALLIIFLIHMYVTALIVLENIAARPIGYKVNRPSENRSLATRLMPYSGTIILAFVIWHLLDFTFIDKHGPQSFLPDGNGYGLYGIVYNTFSNPMHSALYIIAMIAVGLHLSHGIQSFAQTFGFTDPAYFPALIKISNFCALLITVAYSAIPVYVMFHFHTF